MTFETAEESEESGRPYRLFKFVYGPSARYTYTDAEDSYDEGSPGDVYAPLPITYDRVRIAGSGDRASLKVTVPAASDVPALFLVYPPSQPVALFIYKRHHGQSGQETEWSGNVLECEFRGAVADLTCESAGGAQTRPTLKRRHGVGCPYTLYDASTCKASEAAATIMAAVSSVSGTTVTLPGSWHGANAAADFNGGKAYWTNDDGQQELRRILSATATTVRLSGTPRGLDAAETITLTLGCRYTEEACTALHSNIENYGGQFRLAKDNPFRFVNKFY